MRYYGKILKFLKKLKIVIFLNKTIFKTILTNGRLLSGENRSKNGQIWDAYFFG